MSEQTEVRDQKSEASDGKAEAVRTPQVFAGACPRSDAHKQTRVYRTVGQVRYCVCDDCGHTWKKTGPEAGTQPAAKARQRA